jgi:hypothetical protein
MDQATRRSLGPGPLATEARRHRGANKEERERVGRGKGQVGKQKSDTNFTFYL